MPNHSIHNKNAHRSAFTLVELLVVVFIILLLTAMTVPSVMPIVQSRQLREAARQANVFIAAARNRALETGRPYGVMIERFTQANGATQVSLPEMSVSMSYATTPDPYTGGLQTSCATVQYDTVNSTATNSVYRLVSLATDAVTGTADSTWDGVIRPGDEIRFGYKGPWYRLQPAVIGSYTGSAGAVSIPATNIYTAADTFGRQGRFGATTHPNCQLLAPTGAVAPPVGVPVPFEIMRSPVKGGGGSMQFPEGIVIDLNSSGDSLQCFYPRDESSLTNSVFSFYGDASTTPPFKAQDPANLYASTYSDVVASQDNDPVIIMFSPDGSVDRVYTRRSAYYSGTMDWRWDWRGERPTLPIYLLFGRRERIPHDVNDPTKNNWTDLNSLWIKIEPLSGNVLTAENFPYDTSVSAARHWSSINNPGGLDEARSAARAGRPLGGG